MTARPADFRCGIDSLSTLVKETLAEEAVCQRDADHGGRYAGDRLGVATLSPRCPVPVTLRRAQSGETLTVEATALLDTAQEVSLVQQAGS